MALIARKIVLLPKLAKLCRVIRSTLLGYKDHSVGLVEPPWCDTSPKSWQVTNSFLLFSLSIRLVLSGSSVFSKELSGRVVVGMGWGGEEEWGGIQ